MSQLISNGSKLHNEVLLLTKEEFSLARKKLGKTQKQLSELLGMSLKTIHSYEQGWRTIPNHIEKHIYFLLINQRGRKRQSPTLLGAEKMYD